ncbi:hypothetical protein AB0M02_05625 [Actinoplanes sp. NPDC051861]
MRRAISTLVLAALVAFAVATAIVAARPTSADWGTDPSSTRHT